MSTLKAYVANCLIAGDEFTHHPDGSMIRDVVRFKCNKWEFKFRQHPSVVRREFEQFKDNFCKTTTVEVENVSPNQIKSVLKTLENICSLLSFACQSEVVCYGHEFQETGHFESVSGTANSFRPPIEINNGVSIKHFIEQSYPAFHKLHNKRKLSVVFDYLVHADKFDQPTEISLLLLFVALENLKDTYAKAQGIPYINGWYRKYSATQGKYGAKYNFEELLNLMMKSVRMRRSLNQVIALRNEIIHSGLSQKSNLQQWRMYERIQDIIREYIIRVLDYKGEFFTYTSQGMLPKKV
jgi:hypothetical protein